MACISLMSAMALRRHNLPKLDRKIFHAFVDAVLSSGCNEPLELFFVSLFCFLLWGGFCHTATQ